jgi:signal transduction histidine kinase/ActR/RegA family two-component response regulator
MYELIKSTAKNLAPILTPERDYRFTRVCTHVGSILVGAGGAIALFGCLLKLPAWNAWFLNVTPYTLLAFLLCGAALALQTYGIFSHKLNTWLANACAVVIGLIACSSAVVSLLHADMRSQLPLFASGLVSHSQPVAMAIQTTIGLILLAAGIICIGSQRARLHTISQVLALTVLFFALGAALDHIYGFALFTKMDAWSQVQLPIAYMLILAALALFLSKPACGPAAVFTSDTIGGMVARRMLPASALTMASFAAVHFFAPEEELLVFVILVFFLLPILVWIAAAVLDKAALDKRLAHADVGLLNHQLNSQVQELLASHRQMNEALQARAEFLAKVSHELRTPLGGILSTTEMLATTTTLSAEQTELTNITLESGHHLLNLINEILDFSRIDAHKITIENLDVDLYLILTSAVESLRAKAEMKGLSLLSGIGADVPRIIKGDPGRIRQVLVNLIDNAIKFTQRGEIVLQVHLRNQGDKQEMLFVIKDSGIGIPVQFSDRLFQPFVQADGSITRRYGGSGLGLSICKSLVELMGGNIGLKSKIGEGAEFWFTLPLERSTKAPVFGKTANNVRAITTTTKTNMILVVEDNPVNAKVASLQLRKLGYAADIARNGREAVEATAKHVYDLVLMDIQMPEMDGLEATKLIRIRELQTRQHVPIIALTAHAMACDREKCINAGMQDYLTKPPTLDSLSTALKKWISSEAELQYAGTG